ncbi:alpha/beta hydrolase [Domibacillus epiphyticus]|uniref:Carboxylesterase n=1 Tax=Domibacillus epiphyticus TaxID=1714355 RepID=A0A1V2A715_9BACI|nr:alpha/beta fold hydrolase [Domibacillus epiphyticus]OMP66793.1 carboxylesterase [Domibacillus epiphyticus]
MIGCLLVHGFTGAPYEVEPLAEYIKEHTDWTVVAPILPGHGETLSLKSVSCTDWIDCAERELLTLLGKCEKVYVIGFSMGGLIAAYLAARHPISKLVFLSAAAKYVNPSQVKEDVLEMVHDFRRKQLHENELFLRYREKLIMTPPSAAREFQKVVRLARPSLKKIVVPVFIAQGTSDGIVPVASAEYIYSRVSSAERHLHYSAGAKHLICHTGNKKELFEKVFTFLSE